jgi:Restriction endonuclease
VAVAAFAVVLVAGQLSPVCPDPVEELEHGLVAVGEVCACARPRLVPQDRLGANAPKGDRRGGELGTRVWAVTDRGRSMSEPEMRAATKEWRDSFRERRLARRASQAAGAVGEQEAEAEGGWKDQLIARLLQLPPDGFERLAQRILREAGFVNVTVTGKSGDGGIDGAGTYRLSLVSFPVYFQCKRYRGTVTQGS